MTGRHTIGNGHFTEEKQAFLDYFCHIFYGELCPRILKRQSWPARQLLHLDICAGRGSHPDKADEPGSPVIALRQLIASEQDFVAGFVEADEDNARALEARLQDEFADYDLRWSVLCGDHKAVLPQFLPAGFHASAPPLGLLYLDYPMNGMAEALTFLADLFTTQKVLSRVDCLIYLPATTIKRIRTAFPDEHRPTLTQYVQQIPKKHWIIRRPFPSDRHQHIFLLGTQWQAAPIFPTYSFFRLDSPEGQAILATVELTASERQRQPLLLPLPRQPLLFPAVRKDIA